MNFKNFYIINLLMLQKKFGNKWFDECLRSFGAYFFLHHIFKSDTRILHSFTEMSGKDFSKVKKELKEKAVIAEEIMRKSENKESVLKIFDKFKTALNNLKYEKFKTSNNKLKFPSDERVKSKHDEFNKEENK